MILQARALTSGLFLLAALPAQTLIAARPKPVAIVYEVTGNALRLEPGRARQPVRRFDWLPAGAAFEVAPGSRLALAFVTGKRYAIFGPARATLGAGDVAARAGEVRALPAVPPFPRLAPIAEDDDPGAGAGAVRLRGEGIGGLYPDGGASALAAAVTLRFAGVAGAERYGIEVEDRQGKVVYRTISAATRLRLPAGALRPGMGYHWSVRTLDRSPLARGEADFATLSPGRARARETLRRFVKRTADRDIIPLLAGVDRQLGLLAEAEAELREPGP